MLRLLVLYLLDACSASDQSTMDCVVRGKGELCRRYDRRGWDKLVERSCAGVGMLVLSGIIKEATDWLFAGEADRRAGVSV